MLDGKTKSRYNADTVGDQEILHGIYNAIVELKTTIQNSPAIDIEELKLYIELLREEGLLPIKDGDEK